ncbi:unnamed protein product [Camellia sinensis]
MALRNDDGSWCSNQLELQRKAIQHFQKLFQSESGISTSPLTHSLPILTPREVALLNRPISATEVKDVVFSLGPYKAPNLDGIQPFFYQQFWDVVGLTLTTVIQQMFASGDISTYLNKTLITLIPKVDHPSTMNHFRPISLSNVTMRILSKILVFRVRPFLTKLVNPLQSSFIPGRQATDNIVLVQELLHSMHKSKSSKGAMAIKIDLGKAYDRIEWPFLEQVLNEIGFPFSWITLIMKCVSITQLAILWNGASTSFFQPSRGLRQGDPLSPYLFLFCIKKLGHSILEAVNQKRWKPIKISRQGPKFFHLFLQTTCFYLVRLLAIKFQ